MIRRRIGKEGEMEFAGWMMVWMFGVVVGYGFGLGIVKIDRKSKDK
jgi:hypothetical protein